MFGMMCEGRRESGSDTIFDTTRHTPFLLCRLRPDHRRHNRLGSGHLYGAILIIPLPACSIKKSYPEFPDSESSSKTFRNKNTAERLFYRERRLSSLVF